MSNETQTQINTMNLELLEALHFEIRNRIKSSNENNTFSSSTSSNSQDMEKKSAQDELIFQNYAEKLNILIKKLHIIGTLHNKSLEFYKNHSIKVKLPNILSEIFEIENGPKNLEKH